MFKLQKSISVSLISVSGIYVIQSELFAYELVQNLMFPPKLTLTAGIF